MFPSVGAEMGKWQFPSTRMSASNPSSNNLNPGSYSARVRLQLWTPTQCWRSAGHCRWIPRIIALPSGRVSRNSDPSWNRWRCLISTAMTCRWWARVCTIGYPRMCRLSKTCSRRCRTFSSRCPQSSASSSRSSKTRWAGFMGMTRIRTNCQPPFRCWLMNRRYCPSDWTRANL